MGWAGELTAQHRTAQLGARVWAEEPYGFSHSTIYEGIKETPAAREREMGRKRRRETTQNEMSNKEYENMRGRWASADGKWNKKAKKEQDRQARHQRSELIERRKHSKQKKHDKHHLLHVRRLTHRRSDYITFTTRQLLYMCPGTSGSLRLLFCQITLAGGQEEEMGRASETAPIPAKNARDQLNRLQTWQSRLPAVDVDAAAAPASRVFGDDLKLRWLIICSLRP